MESYVDRTASRTLDHLHLAILHDNADHRVVGPRVRCPPGSPAGYEGAM